MNHLDRIGVILAGGKSTRFGRPKAMVQYQERYFYEASLDALQHHTDQVLIISHPTLTNQFRRNEGIRVIEDDPRYQGCGPLAGIFTAIEKESAYWYLTAPCDTPFLKKEIYDILFSYLDQEPDKKAVIPVVNGRKQPLIGLYHRSCLAPIQSLLEQKRYKVGFLFQLVDTLFVEDKAFEQLHSSFVNINRPEDLSEWT
ncbi:molybdenum cofactor guanylyltransferase [Halalkalibacterium halodurans]|uniref:Probable molybdenum cofactor guanylyltransferase n=1 Tax=Halalkalibacterium halodurans TaxID=86665 RepID=A0A0M0KIH0_ALKHA|nr:molybdenum cofactor guanylyltransferase [Halalkalibacterium halodurans]MED3646582.1 molybdenum cofactor guanylyltransferase [Halalkalibacterium halodurans]MED4163035.1 molybdenum cofactor guanylyltransferase [Halalkalibacterium halodurans]TPE66267.1 molybdenum cofactor guanylyltransferase [Halalkalibacterium halodurans]